MRGRGAQGEGLHRGALRGVREACDTARDAPAPELGDVPTFVLVCSTAQRDEGTRGGPRMGECFRPAGEDARELFPKCGTPLEMVLLVFAGRPAHRPNWRPEQKGWRERARGARARALRSLLSELTPRACGPAELSEVTTTEHGGGGCSQRDGDTKTHRHGDT